MKTSRPYEMVERIYQLCNRKQYFNAGSNVQYDMMFYAAKSPEFSCRDVAVMIWTCSVTAELGQVEQEIQEIHDGIERDAQEEAEQDAREAESEYICCFE